MPLRYDDLVIGRRYEIGLADCCVGARVSGRLLAVDTEFQEAVFDVGHIEGHNVEFVELDEANSTLDALLERALRWALVELKVELDELESLPYWPDASGAYSKAIKTIRSLCEGEVEPLEYLDQACREDELRTGGAPRDDV